MRRVLILAASGLLFTQLFAGDAAARGGFGGGGFRGGGFAGGGFGRGGFARPAFAGAGFARPGWNGGGVRWGGWGPRPGWGWRAAGAGWGWRGGWGPGWGWRRGWGAVGAGLAFGALATAPYFGSFGYDDCPVVGRRIWDGFGPRVVWVNSCDYY